MPDSRLDRVRTTERLRLEPVSARHLDDIVALYADAEAARWMGAARTREELAVRLAQSEAAWDGGVDYWTAYLTQTGALVGRGGLARTEVDGEPAHEVAWMLARPYWGHGYATELGRAALAVAFEELDLAGVVAFTQTDNVRSRQVMLRLGMSYQRDVVKAGLPHVLFALTRGEWEVRPHPPSSA